MQPLAYHFVLTRLADHSLVYCCISESTPGHFGGGRIEWGSTLMRIGPRSCGTLCTLMFTGARRQQLMHPPTALPSHPGQIQDFSLKIDDCGDACLILPKHIVFAPPISPLICNVEQVVIDYFRGNPQGGVSFCEEEIRHSPECSCAVTKES